MCLSLVFQFLSLGNRLTLWVNLLNNISLGSPGCTQTHDPPVSTSWVLRQRYAPTQSYGIFCIPFWVLLLWTFVCIQVCTDSFNLLPECLKFFISSDRSGHIWTTSRTNSWNQNCCVQNNSKAKFIWSLNLHTSFGAGWLSWFIPSNVSS